MVTYRRIRVVSRNSAFVPVYYRNESFFIVAITVVRLVNFLEGKKCLLK